MFGTSRKREMAHLAFGGGGNGHLHAAKAPRPIIETHLPYLLGVPQIINRFYIKVTTAAYAKTTCNIRRP